MTVHVLHHGKPLCGFSAAVPGDWPEGDKWVGLDETNDATCVDCLRKFIGYRLWEYGDVVVSSSPNYLGRIDSIYAFLSVDDGGEGVCAGPLGPGGSVIPLIAADKARFDSLRPMGQYIAKITGKVVRVIRFKVREEIEIMLP